MAIGGWDPSGCAGIAADLKTVMAWNAYGTAVITALTGQNTQTVKGVYPVALDIIRSQLESVVSDIEVHAVKVGLLANPAIANLVVSLIQEFRLTNIVVDPVLRSTTGYELGDEEIVEAYKEKLCPIADVLTPNIDEASVLSGLEVKDVESMKDAAVKLRSLGAKHVIITGGHLEKTATDVWYDGTEHRVFEAPTILNTNARGTGCTFASIVAVHLASNQNIAVAIPAAKKYIAQALVHRFQIGKGRGPLNHNTRF